MAILAEVKPQKADELLKDVCDIHLHAAPDSKARLGNELEFARAAREVGVRKCVITHANSAVWKMTHDQIRRCIDLGA